MDLLKTLSELPGAPGREEKVRDFIKSKVDGLADEVRVDAMGNLICRVKPSGDGEGTDAQKVMLACHMDEIAFYVRKIDDDGFIRLQHLGGFDNRNLFARRVRIQTRDGEEIIGNLNPGGKPIHISDAEERKKIPKMHEFFVDTGLSKEELEGRVRPGDPVTLVAEFIEMGNLASGKCLDNRVACWVGIRVLEQLADAKTDYDVYVVFTVQEEIGIRGATTSSYEIDPDIGIAIDTTLAVDTPGVPDEHEITNLGDGVAIKIMDSYTVSHKELVDEFIELAEANEINHQYEILPLGGTDAAALQRARSGSKAITLSVPTRYIHTITETIHKDDLKATVELLTAYLTT
ncbi:M42 family metallopeptidase [Persicimonas caeni]|uniref:M42 family metallopeptidase n=1 Tax=Persicimonas caeni TaxID=2292766 RepID=A0A4Y6PRE6_PERCE|nr:M42 family metallopeptidase [Persicimonas caeni]QDG50886.1 M42 family metallopeptidase [Persicimonas caeni]QED32107.1 M42 family metallopeptidase [Persicimonas caeni]